MFQNFATVDQVIMDDDSNSGFEMVSSQPEKNTYEHVPEVRIYKFKLISDIEPPVKKSYKLKSGLSLPYCTNLCGKYLRKFKTART